MNNDEANNTTEKAFKFRKEKESIMTTNEIVDELIITSSQSLSGLKKLLSVFRSACQPSSSAQDIGQEEGAANRYVVGSPEVYEYVMLQVLEHAHVAFYQHLGWATKDGKGTPKSGKMLEDLGKHPKWKRMQLLVLSFFKSVLYTLGSLAEGHSSQQGQVCVFLISALEPYIPLLAPVPRLAKGTLKVLLRLWSTSPSPDQDTDNVRGHSFLRIRQMSLLLPNLMAEECFRGLYLTYARTCKTFSELNSAGVLMMAQCVAELFSTNPEMAYQQVSSE